MCRIKGIFFFCEKEVDNFSMFHLVFDWFSFNDNLLNWWTDSRSILGNIAQGSGMVFSFCFVGISNGCVNEYCWTVEHFSLLIWRRRICIWNISFVLNISSIWRNRCHNWLWNIWWAIYQAPFIFVTCHI